MIKFRFPKTLSFLFCNYVNVKIQTFGYWGNLIIILIFILTSILAIAGSFAVLCVGCGFLYGSWIGCITSIIGTSLGCWITFFCSRTFLRKWIESHLKGSFVALDGRSLLIQNTADVDVFLEMIRERGFVVVLMARLAIFPPNLMSYMLSITSVSVWAYIFGTFFGLLPGTVMLSFIGASVRDCSCEEDSKWLQIVFWVTLGITIGKKPLFLERAGVHEIYFYN